MKLDQNNIALTSSSEIKQLMSPLSAFNISYFAYTKAYPEGYRVRLTSHPEHISAWCENKFYLQGNCNAKIELYDSQAVLFSTLPNQYMVKWAWENFGIAHGFHIIKKQADYCEFFIFASTPNHPEVVNFYLNHLDFLQRFCEYFKQQAAHLLKKAEKKNCYPFSRNRH